MGGKISWDSLPPGGQAVQGGKINCYTGILTLSYPGSRVDQLWSKLEDIAIITIILSPGCQQPFLIKMASDNRLSAAVFGPKWLVTTGCQQLLLFLGGGGGGGRGSGPPLFAPNFY